MNNNLREIAEELNLVKWNGTTIEWVCDPEIIDQLAKEIVLCCKDIILAHADQLSAYHFVEKANTADSCAGMILEHFGYKEIKNE